MPKIWFDVNIANSIAIIVAYNVLSVLWMKVYSKCFIQSKSLLHTIIYWFLLLQIEAVTEKQNSLMEILDKMENSKTEEEVDSLRPVAQGLKEKADAGLIILNVSTVMEVDSLRPVAQGLKEKADTGLIILNVSTVTEVDSLWPRVWRRKPTQGSSYSM